MTEQTPTIGRIVHYQARGSADGVYPPEPRAAIVTQVHEDNGDGHQVGLCVLNPTGMFFRAEVQQDEDAHASGTWHWPERT